MLFIFKLGEKEVKKENKMNRAGKNWGVGGQGGMKKTKEQEGVSGGLHGWVPGLHCSWVGCSMTTQQACSAGHCLCPKPTSWNTLIGILSLHDSVIDLSHGCTHSPSAKDLWRPTHSPASPDVVSREISHHARLGGSSSCCIKRDRECKC